MIEAQDIQQEIFNQKPTAAQRMREYAEVAQMLHQPIAHVNGEGYAFVADALGEIRRSSKHAAKVNEWVDYVRHHDEPVQLSANEGLRLISEE